MTNLQEEQRQKERVGMVGERIGHKGHHKGVIGRDDDEKNNTKNRKE